MTRALRLAGLAFVALALATTAHADRTKPLAVGDAAPEIKLGDQHGRPFVLGDVLKQRAFVVIAFYPKAFTGG